MMHDKEWENCGQCHYWNPPHPMIRERNGDRGRCRRHAPSPVVLAAAGESAMRQHIAALDENDPTFGVWFSQVLHWPLTWASDWCGEFKQKQLRDQRPFDEELW